MELEKFIQNFADQFEDTDPSQIQSDTVFKGIDEWSSLTALSILAMIVEEYDVALRGDDIENANTVEDLFNIVKSKL